MSDDQPLRGRRILVVEDDYLVASALASLLEEAGASVVGPVGRADDALCLLEKEQDPVHAAILDVDLHGQQSYSVADALVQRNIRFVFATGYAEEALDRRYQRYPRCQKPLDERTLLRALASTDA